MSKMTSDKERRREYLENAMAALARVLKGLEVTEVCLQYGSALDTAQSEIGIIKTKVRLAQSELGKVHQTIKE